MNDLTPRGPAVSPTVGSGAHTYRFVEDWAKLPAGWSFRDVAAVAVDGKDNVYVFNRGEHPMIVFDRDGNFLRSWGEHIFKRAHGLHMGPDETLYCTDDGDHTVRRCALDGKVLLTIGIPDAPAPYMSGQPFNRCTHTALSPKGEIYVSDGYGNSRVHKYSPDGKLLMSWGGPGTNPGEFNIAHNICCDPDGWVYVADRENHRVQVFDGNGKYETQWNNLHRPCALCMVCGARQRPFVYVGELGPSLSVNRKVPNLGPRITVMSTDGKQIARFADNDAGTGPNQFVAPHGIAVDSRGDVYVGEVSYTAWPQSFPDTPIPEGLRSLRKLVKVG
jgi:DNA-binding beta-propeller fold protein YncE